MLKNLENNDLRHILKTCPVGVALSDEKNNIAWVNDTFQHYLGITSEEINGLCIDELPGTLKSLFESTNTVHVPANAIRKDQWFMCQHLPIEGSGNVVHYITDVAPLHRTMQEVELLQNKLDIALAVDKVTGMPNKDALLQALESQISRSRRYNNLLSIVIMRVNHLEQLNETQTNKLLILISHMLNDQVRWADIVGRLSHREFLLVLPETGYDACKKLSVNLRERLKNIDTTEIYLNSDFEIDAIFGYAEWQKGQDLSLLMQGAIKMIDNQ